MIAVAAGRLPGAGGMCGVNGEGCKGRDDRQSSMAVAGGSLWVVLCVCARGYVREIMWMVVGRLCEQVCVCIYVCVCE